MRIHEKVFGRHGSWSRRCAVDGGEGRVGNTKAPPIQLERKGSIKLVQAGVEVGTEAFVGNVDICRHREKRLAVRGFSGSSTSHGVDAGDARLMDVSRAVA